MIRSSFTWIVTKLSLEDLRILRLLLIVTTNGGVENSCFYNTPSAISTFLCIVPYKLSNILAGLGTAPRFSRLWVSRGHYPSLPQSNPLWVAPPNPPRKRRMPLKLEPTVGLEPTKLSRRFTKPFLLPLRDVGTSGLYGVPGSHALFNVCNYETRALIFRSSRVTRAADDKVPLRAKPPRPRFVSSRNPQATGTIVCLRRNVVYRNVLVPYLGSTKIWCAKDESSLL